MPSASGPWLGASLLGIVLGTALQLEQPTLWPWEWYAIVAVLGLSAAGLCALKRIASIACVGVAALAFALVGLRAGLCMASSLDPSLEGRDIAVTGLVAAMPQPGESGTRFRLEVESARIASDEVSIPRRLQLGWYHGFMPGEGDALDLQRTSAGLRPGERWQMTVRLKAPHGHANPHGFDYELWLWEQGVQATGYVRAGHKDPMPRRIGRTWRYPVEQMRHAVREAIFERVADRRWAGILAALVVGDQASIERADWDVFRATGVAHLMSISGLHVTMFAWFAAAAIGAAWRRSPRACLALPAQHAALAGGLLLATAYALFSGWGVPAQRTIWMLATVGLLRIAGRDWPWPWVWLLACAIVVLIDPWALLQPGFWLSFVAVGVLFATDAGRGPHDGDHPDSPDRHREAGDARPVRTAFAAFEAAKKLLREQWIVTVALAPLSLLLFGQVSVVGLVANLVAIPWVTLAVTPLALAGVVAAPLWDAAAWLLQGLALGLEWMARLPFATVSVATPPGWAGAAGLAGGLLLAMPWPWQARALGLPLVLPVLLWQPVRPFPGEFELLAADVGQGNAVIVRTASHTLVYDAGPRYSRESDAGHRVLAPLLRQSGERVDTLVLSHRDSDHTGGAAAVLAMQPQAALLASLEDGHELLALRPSARCEAGQMWDWDGVRFEVLHPGAGETASKPNFISCVLRISNARASALLAGDIEQAQEARLAAGPRELRADVLLVPHHGSKTSSSAVFLDAVQPAFALVQAGYRNRFGHPAPQVVQRYRERGTQVIATPQCGAARWSSAEPTAVACRRADAQRYWYHRAAP